MSSKLMLFALGVVLGSTIGGTLTYLETNFQWEETLNEAGFQVKEKIEAIHAR